MNKRLARSKKKTMSLPKKATRKMIDSKTYTPQIAIAPYI